MTVQVNFWDLVLLMLAFFGFVAGVVKFMFHQFNQKLEQRFTAEEKARKEHESTVEKKLTEIGKIDRDLEAHREKTANEIRQFTDRVARLEEAAEKAVTHDHLAEIHEKVNGIGREVSQLTATVESVEKLMRSIDSHVRGSK